MKINSWSLLLAFICMLTISSAVPRANAQPETPPRSSSSAAVQPMAAASPTPYLGCDQTVAAHRAGVGVIVQQSSNGAQQKSWQPIGGAIQFTVATFTRIPDDAEVVVCFRWKQRNGGEQKYVEASSESELDSDRKVLKVTAIVPAGLGPPKDAERVALLPLVPLAQVRILAVGPDNNLAADASTTIGITNPLWAMLFASLTVIAGLLLLHLCATKRLKQPGLQQANWLLRIISTANGVASLSQLQILLWTFVVAASAVYVMSLSGQLVAISDGTLVLVGIAGAASIAAKINGQNLIARAGTDTAQATAAANDAAKKKADAPQAPPATQIPKWSDLLVSDGTSDATAPREVDIARFQMLMFTLITATFVLISVATTYVIPEISSGFVTLMGISNGVYLGSKIAQS
ncbi:MAG TPA: hypothetical protein VKS22_06665 [Candidatus Binataceae bacterium]|nr:hypothetical protein [Candidatus Binataceae bacterium]